MILVLLGIPINTLAGELANRLQQYPNWQQKPMTDSAQKDLIYPNWMVGTWDVTSILVDQVAPLAPDILSPGFNANRRYLKKAIAFQVRFQPRTFLTNRNTFLPSLIRNEFPIVADRAFNGLNIARAYLGNDTILSVKVDPNNFNRQVTFLPKNHQMISIVTGRSQETPQNHQFMTTEITQQVFRGDSQIYFNEVESSTAYYLLETGKIAAEQITAIYLSPQDPNYFQADGHPIALYRYQLKLSLMH